MAMAAAASSTAASILVISLPSSKNLPAFGLKTLGFERFCIAGALSSGISLKRKLANRSICCSFSPKKFRSFAVQDEAEVVATVAEKTPFGYTRKDVLLIGLGVTVFGFGLNYGLEFAGLDSLKAGNVVQLVMVLGLTVGWIFTYIFRVSTKDMTYAQQLRDYESKVLEKRLEELPEAELEVLLAQVEEEKLRLQNKKRDGLNL